MTFASDIKMKSKKIAPKPTTTKTDIECEMCSYKSTVFYTNTEKYQGQTIEQYCPICDLMTIFRIVK